MNTLLHSGLAQWLQVETGKQDGTYHLTFTEHHLGNTAIRSFHGGVTGAMIEFCAEMETSKQLTEKNTSRDAHISVVSTSIDYLRITRDSDLYARATPQRISRRLSVVHVACWQEDQSLPVAQGIVTLKITSH